MGTEAFFYGYDETWFRIHQPGLVTIDVLEHASIVSEEGRVQPGFAPYIQEIDTVISGNKQWHNNLAADLVYIKFRSYVPKDIRARSDNLLNLLFWDRDTPCCERPAPIRLPVYHGESSCLLYNAATVAYIVDHAIDPGELQPFFNQALADWPKVDRNELGLRNLDDFNTFQGRAYNWLTVFKKVVALGQGNPWALMIHISY